MEAPGGYCSLSCMTTAECGAGGACSGAFAGFGGIGATPGRCLKSCSMDSGEVLQTACSRLGISLVHARPYDPEARGKVERFWRTAPNQTAITRRRRDADKRPTASATSTASEPLGVSSVTSVK